MSQTVPAAKILKADHLVFSNHDAVLACHFMKVLEMSPALNLAADTLQVAGAVSIHLETPQEMLRVQHEIAKVVEELRTECARLKNVSEHPRTAVKGQRARADLEEFERHLPRASAFEKQPFSAVFSLNRLVVTVEFIKHRAVMLKKNATLLNSFYATRDRFLSSIEGCEKPFDQSREFRSLAKALCDLALCSELWGNGCNAQAQPAQWLQMLNSAVYCLRDLQIHPELRAFVNKSSHIVSLVSELNQKIRGQSMSAELESRVQQEVRSLCLSEPLLTLLASGVFELKQSRSVKDKILVCLGIDAIAARFTHRSSGKFPFAGFLTLAQLDEQSASAGIELDLSADSDEQEETEQAEVLGSDEKARVLRQSLLRLPPDRLARELVDGEL